MTEAGIVLGTAAYMSPEQARGKPVDQRADIWAFGCVLYEMLTGKAAFLGDDVTTTLARVLERDPDMRKRCRRVSRRPCAARSSSACRRTPRNGCATSATCGSRSRASSSAPSLRPRGRCGGARCRSRPRVAIGAADRGRVRRERRGPAPSAVAATGASVARHALRHYAAGRPRRSRTSAARRDDLARRPAARVLRRRARDGIVTLYVRELDGLEARLVPGNRDRPVAVGGNMNPFFSPDGKSIGFSSRRSRRGPRRARRRAAAQDRSTRRSPTFLGASWAADDTLVYSSGRSLHRVSAGGGGTPERLMPEAPNGEFFASPVLLPGGRARDVRLDRGRHRAHGGARPRHDASERSSSRTGRTAFYSDTGHVVFARGTTLMAAPFDAAELAVTGEPVAMLENVRHPNAQTAADYALSAYGNARLRARRRRGRRRARRVVWVDRSGAVAGRAVSEPRRERRATRALSPDGTRLVLTTGPPGRRRSLELRPARPAADPARRGERQPRRRLEPRQHADRVLSIGGGSRRTSHVLGRRQHARAAAAATEGDAGQPRLGRLRASCSSVARPS